jgi:hypothetical protein
MPRVIMSRPASVIDATLVSSWPAFFTINANLVFNVTIHVTLGFWPGFDLCFDFNFVVGFGAEF